jgi:DNA polymerase III sliding clamp (beta) subunit (PCNA family)
MDPTYFPEWEPFDTSGLQEVKGLAARMNQVAWACDKGRVPLTGIYLDGATAVATNSYRLARVPLVAPFSEPVTLPQDVIAPLLKETVDAMVGVHDGKFYMMPDDDTQIIANTFATKFPDVSRALNPVRPNIIELDKEQFADSINRMMLLVSSDRYPRLDITIGDERIHIALRAEGVGVIEDQIDLDGQAVHDDCTNYFDPKNFLDAIRNSPNTKLKVGYDTEKSKMPFYIDGGSGYEAWVVPRAKVAPGSGA